MSELADARINPKKSRNKIILITLFVSLIPLLLYGVGFVALPISVMTNFRDKNCGSVLSVHRLYAGLYIRGLGEH